MICTKCKEREAEWDFKEEQLCQDCWEDYCDKTWWEYIDILYNKGVSNANG